MQNRLQVVLENPIFRFTAHLIILIFIWNLISLSYQMWNSQNIIVLEETNLKNMKQKTMNLRDSTDYLNSKEFKEQTLKNTGYKLPGEQVIESNLDEQSREDNQTTFIESMGENKAGNFEKWLACLSLSDVSFLSKRGDATGQSDLYLQQKKAFDAGNICRR